MLLRVGLNITDDEKKRIDRDGIHLDGEGFSGDYVIDSVKVFDLDTFRVYDISLDDIRNKLLKVEGFDIDAIIRNSKSGNANVIYSEMTIFHSFGRFNRQPLVSPLFYNSELIGSELYSDGKWIKYESDDYVIAIDLESFEYSLSIFGFNLIGDKNKLNGDGVLVNNLYYSVEETFKSIVEHCGNVIYVLDTLAICNLSCKKDDNYLVKTGISKVYINTGYSSTEGGCAVALPPCVRELKLKIGVLKKFKLFISKNNAKSLKKQIKLCLYGSSFDLIDVELY